MKSKFLCLFMVSVFLMLCFTVIAPAKESNDSISRIESSVKEFSDHNGRIIGVSSKGEWDDFPENSIPAIEAAAQTDIDFVLIDIKQTSNGVLIVFADDTTERMLFSGTVYTIADTEYSVLSQYCLKNSCGGKAQAITGYKIPTLKEAIDCAKDNDIPLILRCDAGIIPAVAETLKENDAFSMCIIMSNSPEKELSKALDSCEIKPLVIGSKKGNVIFVMNSYVNKLDNIDALGVELQTTNRYGINYYKSVVGSYAGKMRVIANPTDSENCGARQDTEKWWNDLISRGYSVIITDYAQLFADYIQETEKVRDDLKAIYNKYVTNFILPEGFDDLLLNDIKKAYTDAVATADTLLSDFSVSLQELQDCCYALTAAANDISVNFESLEDGSAGTTITIPRIILCVLAAIAVLAVQIYFFKRRRKGD